MPGSVCTRDVHLWVVTDEETLRHMDPERCGHRGEGRRVRFGSPDPLRGAHDIEVPIESGDRQLVPLLFLGPVGQQADTEAGRTDLLDQLHAPVEQPPGRSVLREVPAEERVRDVGVVRR